MLQSLREEKIVDNFHTIEVRWFYPGTLPDEVKQWFSTLGQPLEKIDTRSDFYLQSSSPDVGVKLRQGNLEVKSRNQNLTLDILGDSQIERWSKWICADDRSSLNPTTIANKPGWLKVDKIRDRRLFQVEFVGSIKLTQIATPQDEAVAIEITQLQIQDRILWTIACEYFGDNIDIEYQFLSLVNYLLSEYPLSVSLLQFSGGYPQWLNSLKVLQ
jgi:hypothetical protein